MAVSLWLGMSVVILLGLGALTWFVLRRRFLATVPAPFDRKAWQGRWMSRQRSLSGRVFARFPTDPLPPEGDSEAEVLIFYEFLRGLYWSATPFSLTVVVHRVDERLTNNPDGAALPAGVRRPGRTGFADDLTDSGFVEFEAILDPANLLILGDFHAAAFDELGTFSLHYRR